MIEANHNHGDDPSPEDAVKHRHPPRPDLDDTLTYYRAMEIALRELLIDKGVFTADDIRRQVEDMDNRNPAQGARVVAKAWVDSKYRSLLLSDGGEACVVAGLDRGPYRLVVVENTPDTQTWSSAPCAPVIRAGYWACHRTGTRAAPTVPEWYASRGQYYENLELRSPTTSRCVCTIRPPTCAISCCRGARRAQKDGTKSG